MTQIPNLIVLMNERNVTNKKLAADMGISVKTVEAWKRGPRKPSDALIGKLATYFNVSVEYLAAVSTDAVIKSKTVASKKVEFTDMSEIQTNTATTENLGNISIEDIAMLNALDNEARVAVRMLMQRLLKK